MAFLKTGDGGNGGGSGGVAMSLLWSNLDPTQNFAAQNVILSSSDYDLLLFIPLYSTGNQSNTVPLVIEKGKGGIMSYCLNNTIVNRAVSYTSDTVYAIDGANKNAVQDNSVIIPNKIYGIKF